MLKEKDRWNVMSCLHCICSYLIMSSLIVRCSYFLIFPTDCLFFCRLKINHDSHEFILEFGTVANIMNHDAFEKGESLLSDKEVHFIQMYCQTLKISNDNKVNHNVTTARGEGTPLLLLLQSGSYWRP